MIDVRYILFAILLINILQLPLVQKWVEKFYIQFTTKAKKIPHALKKWPRRAFFKIRGLDKW